MCSTAATAVLLRSKLHIYEAKNASSVLVSRVPGQCLGPYRFMLPITLSLSPSLGTPFPFDHIPVKTRSAIYSFFIRPCLFVALPSTEGSLPADVSSATLQKDG